MDEQDGCAGGVHAAPIGSGWTSARLACGYASAIAETPPFRLALLNPNTDERHTIAMGAVARGALPEGCEVTAVSAARGPSSIESAVDSAVAAAEVAALVQSLPPHDAYLVSCFGDPGVEAARELTRAPVVGIGEAAFQAATGIAKRFAIITTLPRGIPALEDSLERLGIRARCAGIVPLHIPVSEQGGEHADTTDAIVAAGTGLVLERGAEALILACGGMAEVATAVSERVGVPVCDGVAFGALYAYSLWRCGLQTSKTGAYGFPEPIPYTAMPSPSGAA
jgi:allantoin racemase